MGFHGSLSKTSSELVSFEKYGTINMIFQGIIVTKMIFHKPFQLSYYLCMCSVIVAYPTTSVKPTTTPALLCPPGWLHCQRIPSSICIKVEWLCDGVINCPQSWDEQPQNCPSKCLHSLEVFIRVVAYGVQISNSMDSGLEDVSSSHRWTIC